MAKNSKINNFTKVNSSNRSKPMTPKAGYTQTRRRYSCGGKVNK